MPGADRPSGRLSPAKATAALLTAVALLFVAAPRAGAAAYYVGGGEGVDLSVRVVDRQIVWAKVGVREHCFSSRRGNYSRTEILKGLMGPVAIGKKGNFKWPYELRKHTKQDFRSVTVQNISGRIDDGRLVGQVLYYSWFDFPTADGTQIHGKCRGGADTRPSDPPAPVPTTSPRRPEPRGLAFYYGEKKKGIRTLFEARRGQIITAEIGARLYCTDPSGSRYLSKATKAWPTPIQLSPSGRFAKDDARDELPFESLRGRLTPDRITGSYEYTYANSEVGRCNTGSFEPGQGGGGGVPFVAPRR